MSKKPSFEEALRQKMSEVPLPDENASWQKMNALLDEQKKHRGFFFFRNEKIAGGALLLCALLLWLALALQTQQKTTTSAIARNNKINEENKDDYTGKQGSKDDKETSQNGIAAKPHADTVLSHLPASPGAADSFSKNHISLPEKKAVIITNRGKEKSFALQPNAVQTQKEHATRKHQFSLQKQTNGTTIAGINRQESRTSFNADSSLQQRVSTDSSILLSSSKADSNFNTSVAVNKPKIDSASAGSIASSATVQPKRRGSYFVDIGIGIKQQIPVDSQSFAAYNYTGKKSFAGDYIPSLYIRLEKEKKWFIQGEFHYAAPRLINGVSYWQKTKADYGHSNVTSERYDLQKTWYTEIPLSLNIYIRPSWSLGIGAMYSLLHGASARKTSSSYNALSGQQADTISQMPWKGFTDSFLYKTTASLLLQTDYAIKRWSFGARYMYDVQPFLTYTLPDGRIKDKRNQSLEILIRYRLYRSGKFRIGKL